MCAYYSDNSSKNITSDCSFTGFDSTKATKSQKITVSYEEKNTSFEVEIKWKYSFHDFVTELEYGTDGSAGKGGTYVLFGDWPQTVLSKTDEQKISFISDRTVKRGYMDFLLGSDGYYYVKEEEDGYDSCDIKKYSDNSDIQIKTPTGTSNFRYFKVMPIKWRVVTSDYIIDGATASKQAKLLVAENVLVANIPFYDYRNDISRTIDSNTIYPQNYEFSNVRAYLNGISYPTGTTENKTWENKGFLQTAFSSDKLLCTVQVDNSKKQMQNYDGNSWIPSESNINDNLVSNNTFDKVFILSSREVTNPEYGFQNYNIDDRSANPKSGRTRKSTDYALATENHSGATQNEGGVWQLRSPYTNPEQDKYQYRDVTAVGTLGIPETYVYYPGIVPAICISK